MKKMVFNCDMCKRICDEDELLKISFPMPGDKGMAILSGRGLMQGTRHGEEDLCPDCYQKFCWAFANMMNRELVPHNPVKE